MPARSFRPRGGPRDAKAVTGGRKRKKVPAGTPGVGGVHNLPKNGRTKQRLAQQKPASVRKKRTALLPTGGKRKRRPLRK